MPSNLSLPLSLGYNEAEVIIFGNIMPYIGFEKTFAILIIPIVISLSIIVKKYWKDNDLMGSNKAVIK